MKPETEFSGVWCKHLDPTLPGPRQGTMCNAVMQCSIAMHVFPRNVGIRPFGFSKENKMAKLKCKWQKV
jgi:hypothetical protein